MKKIAGIILIVVVVAFTASPLLTEVAHAAMQVVHADVRYVDCCDCFEAVCCNPSQDIAQEGPEDDCNEPNECREDCKCTMYVPVTFTVNYFSIGNPFELVLEEFGEIYHSYHFNFHASIWNPPRA